MIIGVFPLVRSAKTGLQRKRIRDIKLFPHYDSSCGLFGFLDSEGTVWEIEDVTVLVHEAREDALFQTIVQTARVTVHENVLLARMTVQVANKEYVTILLQLLDHILHVVHRWV